MNIIRGDTKNIMFKRQRKDGTLIKDIPEKMYFTIKNNYYEEEPLIQKVLGETITFNEDNGYYYTTIEPEETNSLPYTSDNNPLVFDIEIIDNGKVKTIAKGKLWIRPEVTFASNEV